MPAMTSRWVWRLRELLKKVWLRVIGFAALGVFSAVVARFLSPHLPEEIAVPTGSEAVGELLSILTSSMLAVTTFSLSIAVSAFASAAGSATPRATALLQEDRTTQNVLATFLGAFVFGLIGLIALNGEFYDASGKVVLFLVTVAVIGLVVIALIRWIGHLMNFGRMGDTLDRVEAAATKALKAHLENPYMGGRPQPQAPPRGCLTISAAETGHIQHADVQALHDCAAELGAQVYLHHLPGSFVTLGDDLLSIDADSIEQADIETLRRAVTIRSRRTFEEDPRFGLIVLTEIASKALSPAVNDPGTAMEILGRLTRILSLWRECAETEISCARVFVPSLPPAEVLAEVFGPISRDGASLVEIQVKVQRSLASLSRIAPDIFARPAAELARESLARAEAVPLLDGELASIREECVPLGERLDGAALDR